ncbi:MAG: polyprenyl synthetase family protein [Mycobacteriales bacterium]
MTRVAQTAGAVESLDDRLVAQVESDLAAFLDDRRARDVPAGLDETLLDRLELLAFAGGKRLRPKFAWWAWRAAGGDACGSLPTAMVRALISFELLHCFALIHDDVMDRSATRRGAPSAQVWFARHHRAAGWAGDSERFGDCAAILLGDLALVWAEDALADSALPLEVLARIREPWRAMRTEVVAGQQLDLLAQVRRERTVEAALRVARLKTASYTMERPMHIGAAAAGATPELTQALRGFGQDVGVAFQLRDDMLGVFGDCAVTGKPVGDDLREGKHTVLMAVALQDAVDSGDKRSRELLLRVLEGGADSEATIAEVSSLLIEFGATDIVEERIAALAASARAHLDSVTMPQVAREQLLALATAATTRMR